MRTMQRTIVQIDVIEKTSNQAASKPLMEC